MSFRKFICTIFLLEIFFVSEFASKEIPCELISSGSWINVQPLRTCFIWETTTINTSDVAIVPDQSIDGLSTNGNAKISEAPIEVAKSFPNLIAYQLGANPIRSVSKEHFLNLRKLRDLYIHDTLIELISSDTFEDLVSLQWLYLRKKFSFC